jgi:hypothetical protein
MEAERLAGSTHPLKAHEQHWHLLDCMAGFDLSDLYEWPGFPLFLEVLECLQLVS